MLSYGEKKKLLYSQLIQKINNQKDLLSENRIIEGSIVSLVGDFTPNSIAMMFALIFKKAIIVPLNNSSTKNLTELYKLAQVQHIIKICNDDSISIKKTDYNKSNKFYDKIIFLISLG